MRRAEIYLFFLLFKKNFSCFLRRKEEIYIKERERERERTVF